MNTIRRRDLLAAIPVVALGAVILVLPPAPEQPVTQSSVLSAGVGR